MAGLVSLRTHFITKIFLFLRNVLFVLCAVHVLLLCTFSVYAQETVDLYTAQDNIVNLNNTNFNAEFLQKKNVFVVEFYNSWCGYCIGFAPTWKAFADDVKGWKKVAKVAAVNCAQDENIQLCRDYNITRYPTIRYFWTNADLKNLGLKAKHSYIEKELRENFLNYIQENLEKGVPKEWPNLMPIKTSTLHGIWETIPSSTSQIAIIVEKPDTYVGLEIILDFSSYNVTILRTLSTNSELVSELNTKSQIQDLPSVFILKRSGHVRASFGPEGTREDLRNFIANNMLGQIASEETTTTTRKTTVSTLAANDFHTKEKIPVMSSPVYMADLDNTLYYALKKEIKLKQVLDASSLNALKSFTQLLNNFYPGQEPVRKFLHDLSVHLSAKNVKELSEKQLNDLMKSLETSESYLPLMVEWRTCRGSLPKYRGYPCGLWTLFHVLTVEAYQQQQTIHDNSALSKIVLLEIRDYILNFFSCSECANNFRKESAALEQEVRFPNDTVLWLWETHNRVNKRLSGDASEDPRYPKLQYPPVEICSRCHLEGSSDENPVWNKAAVMDFLVEHYSNIKINDNKWFSRKPHAEPEPESFGKTSGAEGMKLLSWKRMSWFQFQYFSGTDISLCVFLYVTSGVLLVIVYLFIMLRRKRRKTHLYKLP